MQYILNMMNAPFTHIWRWFTKYMMGSSMQLKITDQAANRIETLVKQESEDAFLRVAIQSGGCSGFQYDISLDNHMTPDDLVFSHMNAKVVIDDISLGLLDGGVLDFVEDMVAAKFVITNPNASAGCGCGKSFAL